MRCPKCASERSEIERICYICKYDFNNGMGPVNAVNKPLIPSLMHELQHYAYKFNIKTIQADFKDGSETPNMRGMKQFTVEYEGFKIQINLGNQKSLVVFLNKNPVVLDPIKETKRVEPKIFAVAHKYAKEKNIEINDIMIPISKEVKGQVYSNVNFIGEDFKAVYPIPSPIEAINKRTAPQQALNLTLSAEEIAYGLTEFSRQIIVHNEATRHWDSSAIEVKNAALEVKDAINELKNSIDSLKPRSFFSRLRSLWK